MSFLCRTGAIPLSVLPYSENSVSALLLTRDYGPVRVLAKGARRLREGVYGPLLPGTLGTAIFYHRKDAGWASLSYYETETVFLSHRHSWPHHLAVAAALEIASWLSRGQGQGETGEDFFSLLAGTLRTVAKENPPGWSLLSLAWRAIVLAGLEPETARCAVCESPLPPADRYPLGGHPPGPSCPRHLPGTAPGVSRRVLDLLPALAAGQVPASPGEREEGELWRWCHRSLLEISESTPLPASRCWGETRYPLHDLAV